MPDLIIGETFATVHHNDKCNWYKTDLFFGDVMSHLEENYPKMSPDIKYNDECLNNNVWWEYINKDISGEHPFLLWGLSEGSSALANMYKFLLKDDYIRLTFKMVEELRLYYHFESYHNHDSFFDGAEYPLPEEKAVTFKNLNTITQVLCSALYYYALNDYKIKKCAHCGKWFATKNGNIDYCNRNSPIEKYSHLKCVEAQQRLRKNSGVNHPLKKRFNVLSSTLDRLIDQKGLPIEEKRNFLETAKIIRKTKTDEEYSQWLFEQEKKYKTRTKKAYSDKEKDGVKNGNNK